MALGASISRVTATAGVIAVSTGGLSACGGGHARASQTRTVTVRPAARLVNSDEVLVISGLGTFEGRCPRGASSWTLRFVDTGAATDTVAARVGTAPERSVNVDPSGAITFSLTPDAARTSEPADRFVPPPGQGRGRAMAMTVSTTEPLQVTIYQGTEPQTLRADVRLALSTIGGESGQCVLVGSTVDANTYPNQP